MNNYLLSEFSEKQKMEREIKQQTKKESTIQILQEQYDLYSVKLKCDFFSIDRISHYNFD